MDPGTFTIPGLRYRWGEPMKTTATISSLPQKPAVYALMGGYGRNRYVAYVGVASKLRQRIIQHLVNRDSSVATGTSAACLNPDYVSEIRWWEHKWFRKGMTSSEQLLQQ